jgi:hypothetical protein
MHTRTLLGVVAVINEHPASVYAEEKNIATLLPATRQVKRRGDKPLYLVAEKSVAS